MEEVLLLVNINILNIEDAPSAKNNLAKHFSMLADQEHWPTTAQTAGSDSSNLPVAAPLVHAHLLNWDHPDLESRPLCFGSAVRVFVLHKSKSLSIMI